MAQIVGKVKMPPGKTVAVNIGVDFDAQALWIGSLNLTSPAYMSRGEFGAEVGVPRLLKLFDQFRVHTTWCIPGHTVDTWPELCREVRAAGHEIAHHGYAHEDPISLSLEQETRAMEMGLDALARIGVRPRVYRAPYWEFSPNSLMLIEKYGFEADSSLMANDLHPYRIRPLEVHADRGNVFLDPSPIVEIPGSWYLADFPAHEYITGHQEGMCPAPALFGRWREIFDYAAAHEEGACFIAIVHPQTSGRAHLLSRLEELFAHMSEHGAWFATLSEILDATQF